MRPPANPRWIVGFLGSGLAFCAVTYPALPVGFVADDVFLLARTADPSIGAAFRFFVTPWGWGYFRPLVDVSPAWDQSLYGAWAPGVRLTNVAAHLACTMRVFTIAAGRLRLSREAAATVVSEPDRQGKIRRLSLTNLPAEITDGTACLAEFREGRFRALKGCVD